MFLPRVTSLSVALVHRRILKQVGWGVSLTPVSQAINHPYQAAALSRDSPLALQEEDHVVDAHGITDKVCAQQPSLRVGDVEGLETLAKLVSCSNGSQRAGQVLPEARIRSIPHICGTYPKLQNS